MVSLLIASSLATTLPATASVDAIGIASLQGSVAAPAVALESSRCDAAPAVSPASEVDAIGIASLQLSTLNPLDLDADWQALIESMHAVERVAAPFVEARTFAFRKEPKQYRGVFRKDADGRVSLAYTEPEAMALHMGEGFAYYRKGEGAIRRIAQSNSQGAALALFPQLLNFNLPSIAEFYEIAGALEGDAWTLVFSAKPDLELPYQKMSITGLGIVVKRIELSKSETQQVLIEMGDPVYPEFYLPEAKAAYFFRLESK
jgi:hypothetical protein